MVKRDKDLLNKILFWVEENAPTREFPDFLDYSSRQIGDSCELLIDDGYIKAARRSGFALDGETYHWTVHDLTSKGHDFLETVRGKLNAEGESRRERKQIPEERYQVALSFASEQRAYARQVAEALEHKSISVFYDKFKEADLWGKSLTDVFEEVFGHKSTYVVFLISKEWVNKNWTRQERRSALSSAIKQRKDHILPVRFDDTPVPGLPGDVAYVHANDHSPADLASMIAERLGIEASEGKASQGGKLQSASSMRSSGSRTCTTRSITLSREPKISTVM